MAHSEGRTVVANIHTCGGDARGARRGRPVRQTRSLLAALRSPSHDNRFMARRQHWLPTLLSPLSQDGWLRLEEKPPPHSAGGERGRKALHRLSAVTATRTDAVT